MFARESPISRDVQVRSAEGAKLLPIELLLFSTSWPRSAPTLPRPRRSLGLPQRRCNRSLPQPSLPPPAASRRCCVCKSRGQAPTRCSSEPSQRALPRVALQAPHVCIRPIRVDKFSVGLTYNCDSYAVARHFHYVVTTRSSLALLSHSRECIEAHVGAPHAAFHGPQHRLSRSRLFHAPRASTTVSKSSSRAP